MAIQQKPVSGIGEPISIRTITLEEHFTTAEFLRATAPFTPALGSAKPLEEKLLDLGEKRISAMDEGGVDFQILSLAATAQDKLAPADATVLVSEANDAAFAATERYPRRLGMFSSLALRDPAAAAKELERGVLKQKSLGGFVNGTEGGSFLDDPRYSPVLEAAEALDVPLYLHPAPAPEPVQAAYFSGLPEASAYFLSTAAWGWHAELGMHALRLILAGVFDRFPRLRIIIGHMGENIPFSLLRAQDGLPPSATGLKHSISEAFLHHFVITTSGYFTNPPFLCALQVLGVDRILYSVDYPYRSNTAGARFLEGVQLPTDDLRKIASGNAESILKLQSN